MKIKRIDLQSLFVVCLIFQKKNPIQLSVKLKELSQKKIIGKRGFGYDPIFIPDKYLVTFGQMPKLKKILIDHRYIAFQKIEEKN